jgi:hypothetical protein
MEIVQSIKSNDFHYITVKTILTMNKFEDHQKESSEKAVEMPDTWQTAIISTEDFKYPLST